MTPDEWAGPAGAASWQVCQECGDVLTELDPRTRCDCGGLLEIRHQRPMEEGAALRRRFIPVTGDSGVWRFRALVMPSAPAPVSWPEGNTPLVQRDVVAGWAGVMDLRLKHEGMNPTGSFKDRGMTVGITQAVRAGARAVACASTGNTAASLAAYAALAGLPAVVLVPAGKIALGKLGQALAYGARTLMVDGDFDTCLRLVRDAEAELGITLLNSVNPWRLEGQKTIVLELLQQLAWNPPDWIALPAGNLGNTAAFGKALREARDLGLIDRLPRLAAIQAEGAAPFAQAYAEGFTRRHRVRAETVASAIRIGDPASWDRARGAIGDTGGVVAAVSDAAILEAKAVIDRAGVGCEPASAASVAGVRSLRQQGIIGADQRVVAILTGHLLKDPEIVVEYHRDRVPLLPGANPPRRIPANLEALARAIGGDQ